MEGDGGSLGTIALCEDDADIRELLRTFLAAEGYEVLAAANGRDLDSLLANRDVDLVVLDWMLPGEDGLSICRRLHEQGGIRLLMLTARDADIDMIAGLETGAVGYLTKPANPHVLLAYIRAALRDVFPAAAAAPRLLAVADIVIDVTARIVRLGDDLVPLSGAELELLICFAERPQRVLSRDHLMACTRGREPRLFDRTIDMQVSRMKTKLDGAGSAVAGLIRAVRSVGYILAAPVERR